MLTLSKIQVEMTVGIMDAVPLKYSGDFGAQREF